MSNNRFKFRAWTGTEMLYNIFPINNITIIDNNWSTVHVKTVMQHTDLEDKNGKEIYEGDIVRQLAYSHNFEIVFYKGRFCMRSVNGYTDFIPNEAIEVIGNIYEEFK